MRDAEIEAQRQRARRRRRVLAASTAILPLIGLIAWQPRLAVRWINDIAGGVFGSGATARNAATFSGGVAPHGSTDHGSTELATEAKPATVAAAEPIAAPPPTGSSEPIALGSVEHGQSSPAAGPVPVETASVPVPASEPAPPEPAPVAVSPDPAPDPVGTKPPGEVPSAGSAVPAATMAALGDRMLQSGDVAAARLYYGRAAALGDSEAALRLAGTYDPAVLRELGAAGIKGDRAAAIAWYRKAEELGHPAARPRLKALLQENSSDR